MKMNRKAAIPSSVSDVESVLLCSCLLWIDVCRGCLAIVSSLLFSVYHSSEELSNFVSETEGEKMEGCWWYQLTRKICDSIKRQNLSAVSADIVCKQTNFAAKKRPCVDQHGLCVKNDMCGSYPLYQVHIYLIDKLKLVTLLLIFLSSQRTDSQYARIGRLPINLNFRTVVILESWQLQVVWSLSLVCLKPSLVRLNVGTECAP